MISLLLLPNNALCLEPEEALHEYIEFYVDKLENNNQLALGVFAVAILINFLGIRARRLSLSAIIYSGFCWGSNKLEKLVDSGLQSYRGEDAFVMLEYLKDALVKINTNPFFMAFLCIALGIAVFFFVKLSLYLLMTCLVYYLWKVLETSLEAQVDGNPYYIYQAVMLCIGLLTLLLVKQTVFFVYLMVFIAFGSLFMILGANSGFGLKLKVSEGFSEFLDNGLNNIVENKVILLYVSLISIGLICQLFVMKQKQ